MRESRSRVQCERNEVCVITKKLRRLSGSKRSRDPEKYPKKEGNPVKEGGEEINVRIKEKEEIPT